MDSAAADDTAELIHGFIKQRFPLASSKELTQDLSLLDSGIVDSLGVLDLVGFIEEQFGIEAQDEDLVPENFDSIDALTRFVKERRRYVEFGTPFTGASRCGKPAKGGPRSRRSPCQLWGDGEVCFEFGG